MISLRTLLISAAAMALAGCALGPGHEPPIPPASAEGQFLRSAQPAFTNAEPPDQWWRLFQSPVVDALVAQALEANRDIAVAEANLAEVRAMLGGVRGQRLPTTTAFATANRARQFNPFFGAFEFTTYTAGIDVAYEFDLFGRVRRSIEAARADAEAAEAALQGVRIAVAAETARAFADTCSANAQLGVARRAVALQTDTAGLVDRRLEAGRGTGLDTANAAAQLQALRAGLAPLEAQRDAALLRLTLLLGRTPAQAPVEALDCSEPPTVAGPLPVGDGAGLIRRRPDVRQAERALAAATARIGLAQASLFPSISFGGGASAIAIQGLGSGTQFNIGPLVSWSFPNMAAARAQVARAGAGAERALAQFDQTLLGALQETETALAVYAGELERRAELAGAVEAAGDAARLARLRFEAGADSYLAVLDAERTLASLQAQLVQSEAEVANDQILVFKALGGGWAAG